MRASSSAVASGLPKASGLRLSHEPCGGSLAHTRASAGRAGMPSPEGVGPLPPGRVPSCRRGIGATKRTPWTMAAPVRGSPPATCRFLRALGAGLLGPRLLHTVTFYLETLFLDAFK